MTTLSLLMALKFFAIVITTIAITAFVVVKLWNWLVPELFTGPRIKFKHALGIMALSFILFGGLNGGRHWSGNHGLHDGNCTLQEQCNIEKNSIK